MKLLLIHADQMEFEAKSKTKIAEEVSPEKLSGSMEETLVCFVAVEKEDEGQEARAAELALKEVTKQLGALKCNRLVLYPYAHLSPDLSSPHSARKAMNEFEKIALDTGIEVIRAPFGWYKSFKISCKGHPLSELSKKISVSGGAESAGGKMRETELVSESIKKEAECRPTFHIMTPDGKLHNASTYDFSQAKKLGVFAGYETKKDRKSGSDPPHIPMMKAHLIADFEPGSDSGNMRWYPNGRMMKKVLESRVTQLYLDSGAMEVETPIMYDFKHPALEKYLSRFPARQYVVKSDTRDYFLRFAACFGQFLMASDMNISYKTLPLKIFELTKYSFRREQSGELCGLRRLRSFTMPDMHTLCMDMEQARSEFYEQFEMSVLWLSDLHLDYEAAFRAQRSYFEENRKWYESMAAKIGRPILIELFEERYAYFVTKFEFNFIDSQAKAAALSTVQIDVDNSETFDISTVNAEGKRVRPIILHASISGAIERCIYAVLERESERIAAGEKGQFPFALAPTQIRLIPVKSDFIPDCQDMASKVIGRCDIDDREEKLGKRIRDAEKEWVEIIAVFGQKERDSGKLSLRMRDGTSCDATIEELNSMINKMQGDLPAEKLALARLLSKRPIFR